MHLLKMVLAEMLPDVPCLETVFVLKFMKHGIKIPPSESAGSI